MRAIGYRLGLKSSLGDAESMAIHEQMANFSRAKGWRLSDTLLEHPKHRDRPFCLRPIALDILGSMVSGDVILVPKHDCLFRTAKQGVLFIHEMRNREIVVHSLSFSGRISSGPFSDLILTLLRPIANAEQARKSDEMKEVKLNQREHSRYLGGGIPFGFKVNSKGYLQPDKSKEKLTILISELRGQGKSLREISDILKKKGFALSHMGVQAVLRSTEPYRAPSTRSIDLPQA